MNNTNQTAGIAALTGVIGIAIGIIWQPAGLKNDVDSSTEKKPLYWVAPMDPNYKRDKPGKSPMGMDLIPVYVDDNKGSDLPGTVKISAVIENNLGVRVDTIRKSDLNLIVNTVGYITFDEEQLTHFHSRVDGWIEQLSITAEGDRVKKGQKLFELYSPELVTAQEEYLAALGSGSAIMKKASSAKLAALGVSQNQIQTLKNSRHVKQYLDFYAGEGGYVAELNIREGMFIKPATTILSIGNLDTVWVIAEIFERQAAWIKVGQTVEMRVGSYPDEQWIGSIDYIYPVLDLKTRTVKARIEFSNNDHRLQPNMIAEMTIKGLQKANALTAPLEAIIYNNGMARVVKALGKGRYRSVRVKTGVQSGDHIEITEGLQEGDQVVISAQFMLDSESSISADLSRIENEADTEDAEGKTKVTRVWASGVIEILMANHHKATIKHNTIPEWEWPAMSMEFDIAKEIDLGAFQNGQAIQFCIDRFDDAYQITHLEIAPVSVNSQQQDHKVMQHD